MAVNQNQIFPVNTTLIDPTTTGGNNYVGFQGDFVYDSAVISFVTSGTLSPPVQRAGLTSDPNWNVSANILNNQTGTLRTLRISAFMFLRKTFAVGSSPPFPGQLNKSL